MAEEEDDLDDDAGGGEGGAPAKKGKKKLILIIALAVLLVLGGLAGAYFSGLADSLLGKKKTEASASSAAGGKDGMPAQAVFYDLPEMLVDLSGDARKRTFLKIRVSLELNSAGDVAGLEAVMPRIIDNFQTYLRELRTDDLQGSEGIYRLREELLMRVNQAIQPTKIKDVLFKEMLLQ